jgi:hypothetical protein
MLKHSSNFLRKANENNNNKNFKAYVIEVEIAAPISPYRGSR